MFLLLKSKQNCYVIGFTCILFLQNFEFLGFTCTLFLQSFKFFSCSPSSWDGKNDKN